MEKKKPSFLQSISCIIFLFAVILVGTTLFNIKIQPLLLIAAAYATIMGLTLGYSWLDIEKAIAKKLEMSMSVMFILMVVGALVGTWIFSGTVPIVLYYGLKLISPSMFLITAFLLTCAVAVATGTTWGAAATAGVALMGVAVGMGIPSGIAAGAVIAGAVVGDKLSPLSDTTNLCPLVCDITVFQHIGHTAKAVIPATVVALIIYYIQGKGFVVDATSAQIGVQELIGNLEALYDFNFAMFLPAIVILVGSVMKKPTVPLMIISAIVAIIVGVTTNGMSITDGFNSMMSGFNPSMFRDPSIPAAQSAEIATLVTRGGISSMMTVVITIFCGYSFAAVIQEIGCLDVMLDKFTHKVNSPRTLIFTTMIISTILVFTAGVASISILMTGLLLKDAYKKMGIDTRNLARTLETSGTMFLPFVPWGTSALFYIEILGVYPGEYWIWTIPCSLAIVFEIIYVIFNIAVPRKDYQVELEEVETTVA
ncbi:Na+/H+ antiporter NhaC [Anaerotignum sp.]|uniref:Na+/H+ antiporter NhaC n=1 Tax=Anaerotignum sp. TaxID=2039241 RepID=UPI0028A5E1CD|nr:Na+/H+ antiporter NhaC [Anaerotignum sp.]